MKNIILLAIFLIIIIININCQSNMDPFSFSQFLKNYSDAETSATYDNQSKLSKGLIASNMIHASFAGISYLGMLADCILGNIYIYYIYQEENYIDAVSSATPNNPSTIYYLKNAHRILTIPTFIFLESTMIMSWITVGIKASKNMPINIPHFASSTVTTFFNIVQIILTGITAYAFSTNHPYAKEIALVHGVFSYVLFASFTITLITIPIGMRNKKKFRKI